VQLAEALEDPAMRFLTTLCAVLFAWSAMAADKPVVVLAGATGETGLHTVRALVEKGYAVRGLVRDAAKAKAQNGEIATWIKADVRDAASLAAAFAGATYAISTIGSRERDGPNNFENIDWLGNRNLIDAAKTAGVKHYVLMTSGSAGTGSLTDPEAIRFGAGRIWKGKAEEHLRAIGLPYTVVAPGGLRNYAGGEKGILLLPRNQYKVGVVSRADVATVMVECLTNMGCLSKTLTIVNTDQAKANAWLASLETLPRDTADTVRLTPQPATTKGQ
jgi:uncharacterized protein YbjT (DUF2867 family)